MTHEDKIIASERVCRNCRYLSCAGGATLRCADPAALDFHRDVAPRGSCGRFQISFKAVRQLAFASSTPQRAEVWEMAMQRRANALIISAP